MEQVTFKDIKKSKEVNAYIYKGNSTLGVLGYTDHSAEHAVEVSWPGKFWSAWDTAAIPSNWQK